MSGIFSKWQPRYAERGIPTFPLDGEHKKPQVTNYGKMGLPASHQIAQKPNLAAASGIGFMAGRRNKITVLDIDIPNERVAADAFARHGEPALIVRTASGKFHGWYRFNGEKRAIDAWKDEHPKHDLLGGGIVVAPPTMRGDNNYEFIKGSLDDLDQLKPMEAVPNRLYAVAARPRGGVPVPRGGRNQALFDHCRHHARHCDNLEALIDVAMTYRDNCLDKDPADPITDNEAINTARSAWQMQIEGRNWIGQGGIVPMPFAAMDRLLCLGEDAAFLFLHLKRHHNDRETFLVANAMAELLQWGKARFKMARQRLLDAGLLRLVRQGGRRPHDPSIYGWGELSPGRGEQK